MTRIEVIANSHGVVSEGDDVPSALVQHYESFLGREDDISLHPTNDLFDKKLLPDDANHMVRSVTSGEVKLAMFSIGNDKAPSPNGYTAAFFKHAWQIIGQDISCAIIDFFSSGKLLRELNNTLIVLIPKKPTPSNVTDYRPIACCNVIYKCISKIIADRIKHSLNQIVSINQSAFVPGRKISDNILLTQELMHNYHRNYGPPRCAFKVDIQKAYDTVDWRFLKQVLIGFGFHVKMVDWIMLYVSSPTYSICVNGEVHGYFKGRRGLRQGDLLSPYLFTLVMEILTSRVIKDLEAKMRNFLWSQEVSFHRGKVKVSWKVICVPKYEGGLGIRRLGNLELEKTSSVTANGEGAYMVVLGTGNTISAWYDTWCQLGPLSSMLSPRVITNAGFRLDAMVSDVYRNGAWVWPAAWRDLFPVLNQLDHTHPCPNKLDHLYWKHGDELMEHSSFSVWNSMRTSQQEVDWTTIVWFPQCIPRHAFLVWLIMRRKLLTQDKILNWGLDRRKNMNMMCCLLCYADVDSHDHLFFECNLSAQVWSLIRTKVGMDTIEPKWMSIVNWLMARQRSKTAEDFVARLLVGAAAYTIWQERNARLFKNQTRPPDILCEIILKTVRYKLMGVKFKSCANVRRLLGAWEIHVVAMEIDGG
ncbi:uncharacterized protein LOC110919116 [Helianthus annuus]|uniref:uncharacterized protein LOC110919116 n=1 Tax=Helianthus annuus TaxID=4232 RepID=UPI000B8FD35B|nr:uncharacterized protein LOC110919116 [Helianthus annuus]